MSYHVVKDFEKEKKNYALRKVSNNDYFKYEI